MKPIYDNGQIPLERVERCMIMAAELVDWAEEKDGPEAGDQMRPLLDYWRERYIARKNRKSAVDEVRELIEPTDV
ncbi:hypothetical protein [Amorphus orientalis]|uniref:Uncharacterized protein n=1 Tax=Amorphus orientalis TaxID=649198 RepID=A0AAE3VT49_9HYPH|nr:hypothetical protein [Amorphus orientalis]MDQ0317350.1 hypothetical protein [Amorphus orientalis]